MPRHTTPPYPSPGIVVWIAAASDDDAVIQFSSWLVRARGEHVFIRGLFFDDEDASSASGGEAGEVVVGDQNPVAGVVETGRRV